MKGQERKTTGILWNDMIRLSTKMKRNNNRLYLLVLIQSFMGLRVGDILGLKWKDFYNAETLNLVERKTGKTRKIALNPELIKIVKEAYEHQKFGINKNELIFLNRAKTKAIDIGYINRELKKAFKKYEIETSGNISSHCFRKTFSIKILEDNNYSEKGIFLVSSLLNHSSINTTMKYLNLDLREQSNAYLSLSI